MSSVQSSPRERTIAAADVRLTAVITALTALGFVLRLAAARGDLWLDEIWSFRLLQETPSFWSIFFDLPNDNNHVLNTAWLAIVGPNAPSVIVRLPAVVFGTLCIPVAARIGARRSATASVFAAAAVAVMGIFVQYGSEARGYAGLILAAWIALDCLEVFLADPSRRTPLIGLGAAIAFGTLSQLSMLTVSIALGSTAMIALILRHGWTRAALRTTAAVAVAIVVGSLPALICLGISISHAQLHIGLQTPFTWSKWTLGLARAFEATIGLPDDQSMPWATVVTVSTLVASTIGLALVSAERRIFPAVAIFGLPLLQWLLHVPNEQYARFHLVSCLGLVMLAFELAALVGTTTAAIRRIALVLLALVAIGQTYNVTRLIRDSRGSFRAAVADMGADGPTNVILRPNAIAGETSAVISWYAVKAGVKVDAVPDSCPAHAQWLLVAREPGDSLTAPDQSLTGPPGCDARFALRHAYPAYGLSGFTWLLFRRQPDA